MIKSHVLYQLSYELSPSSLLARKAGSDPYSLGAQ